MSKRFLLAVLAMVLGVGVMAGESKAKQPETGGGTKGRGASVSTPGKMTVTAKPKKCPFCGSTNIKPYLFGLPTKEAMESGKYILGGCCITDDMPSWGCVDCGSRFYRP